MSQIGTYVLYVIMACAILGAFAAIRDSERGLGYEFLQGIYQIGPIFIPVAGIMASIPYLSKAIVYLFGPLFSLVGADPAIAATTIIAVDMGGYQLAEAIAATKESWIMAMITGYMAGATIVFSVPVGLVMLDKRDHKYLALGVMSGILTVPIGVLASTCLLALTNTPVRDIISTDALPNYYLDYNLGLIFANLLPLFIICVLIALGLRYYPNFMIKAFLWFGKIMDTGIKLVLVFSIVEYFTGVFSTIFGYWGFDPIIADSENQFRALEIAGYIGVMLAGAFPMVYLIKKYLAKPLERIGRKCGFTSVGSAGILAASANILAMYRIIKDMPPKDKVRCISFAVCCAFLFGDHMAFTANFQPTMIACVVLGKITGGLLGIALATWLSVPRALELEQEDRAAGIIKKNEYLNLS